MTRLPLLIAVVALIGVAAIPGCTIPGSESPGGADIVFHGNMERTTTGFSMDGQLAVSGGISQQDSFANTSILLCSRDGEVLEVHRLGTLHDGERKNVSLESTVHPHFVVFDSPHFWQERDIAVQYYEWNDEHPGYRIEWASAENELPCQIE